MRARNMQALTDDVKRKYPGVVVYGIGDDPHKLHESDHNEDDTPGSKAAQSDKDNVPEHRGIDVMLGPAFAKRDADGLVERMLADPEARARLYGIIWYGSQWWRSTGFKREPRGHDHDDHVHFSGLASDDENTAGWPAVYGKRGVSDLFCQRGQKSEAVGALQVRLKNLGFYEGEVDDDFGPKTEAALKAACLAANENTTAKGNKYDKFTMYYVDMLLIQKYAGGAGEKGPKGDPGPAGPAGPPGEAAVLPPGSVLVIQQPEG